MYLHIKTDFNYDVNRRSAFGVLAVLSRTCDSLMSPRCELINSRGSQSHAATTEGFIVGVNNVVI